MSQKSTKTLILFIILIVLILLAFFWKNPFSPENNKTNQTQLSFDLTNLQKIEINSSMQNITLDKSEESWLVSSQENVKANQTLVNNLIETITNLEKARFVTQDQEKLSNFGLSEEQAVKLKLFDNQNNQITEIIIGKSGPAYFQTYIKLADSDQILLANQNLNSVVNQPDWQEPPPVKITDDEQEGEDTEEEVTE